MTLPFDLGPGATVWLAVAVTIAAFVRGYSGFGYSAMVIAAVLAGSGLVKAVL